MLHKNLQPISKKTNNLLPFYPADIPDFYWQKVQEEEKALGGRTGPLSHIAFPPEKLLDESPYVLDDPVADYHYSIDSEQPFLIHKYPDRLLFLPTFRCIGHCKYCFRDQLLYDAQKARSNPNPLSMKLQRLTEYLKQHPTVSEVILSGGDPLSLSYKEMALILSTIHNIPTVRHIRIHTRAIIYDPIRLQSNSLIHLLKEHQVRLFFHIVHPYEICNLVEETILKLTKGGVHCYNQFPMLRNVNDHSKVIIRLIERLDTLGVNSVSVYYPDAVHGSGPFRISFKRIFQIIDEVQWQTPSWINAVKFCLDSEIGKVQRENLVKLDSKNHYAIFTREGKTIQYPDWPEELDIAGDPKILLWKEASGVKKSENNI